MLAGCARQSSESDVWALSVCLGSGYRRCASVRNGAPTGPRRSRRRLGTPHSQAQAQAYRLANPAGTRSGAALSKQTTEHLQSPPGWCVCWPAMPYMHARACQQPRACQRRCCKWWKLQLVTQATCTLWMARCHLCTANSPGTKALVPSCCCKWCKATCTLWVARCHLCTAANCPGTRALGTHGPLDPAAPEGKAGAAREGQ